MSSVISLASTIGLLAGVGIGSTLSLVLLLLIAALLAVGGLYVTMAIKRWAQRPARFETFTLQNARDLRAQGQITEDEFRSLRAALLGRPARQPPREAPPAPPDHPS